MTYCILCGHQIQAASGQSNVTCYICRIHRPFTLRASFCNHCGQRLDQSADSFLIKHAMCEEKVAKK